MSRYKPNEYLYGAQGNPGLANYIIREKGENRGVAIAYDSRNHSRSLLRKWLFAWQQTESALTYLIH